MTKKALQDASVLIIRERGVNAKGFGHVAKRVMTDSELSITSKGIYGYLSSMAGSGDSSFTKRSRILSELNLGERAYDTNMKALEQKGYIARAQSRTTTGFFGTTIIEFVMIPEHLSEEILLAQQCEQKPTMYSGTIYALGYGSIPRLVMQDGELSVKAKGLYAYFCAYAGPGNESFPSRVQIMKELAIGKNAYNDYRKELEGKKYITAFQKNYNGCFAGNSFRINQFPEQVEDSPKFLVNNTSATNGPLVLHPFPENSSTGEPFPGNSSTGEPFPGNACTDKPCTVNACTENASTYINNNNNKTNNNSLNINTPSITPCSANEPSVCEPIITSEREREAIKEKIQGELLEKKRLPYHYSRNYSRNEMYMTEAIHFLTDWDIWYPNGYSKELEQRVFNLFNQALIEMCCATRSMNLKGSCVTYAKVIDKINELGEFEDTYADLSEISQPAMTNYISGAKNTEIHNPLQYMKSCIWDAMLVGDIGIYEQMRRDGMG